MLDLYYHLHDDDSQQAMLALAGGNGTNGGNGAIINRDAATWNSEKSETTGNVDPDLEGSLRAVGQSTIEKLSQVREFQEFVNCLENETEREGFEPPLQLPADRISNAAPSATRTPLQALNASVQFIVSACVFRACPFGQHVARNSPPRKLLIMTLAAAMSSPADARGVESDGCARCRVRPLRGDSATSPIWKHRSDAALPQFMHGRRP